MVSLVLIVFLVQLGIHLLNTLGSAAFSEWIWALYNKFPTSTSARYNEVIRLRREAVTLKQQLNATSAQDEFAKWAKLQRQYDKTKADHDKKAADIQAFEGAFKGVATAIRVVGTFGLRFFMQLWYGPVAMFWLPRGWMPGYVEWLLAFPKAPSGSISINMWFMACGSIIAIISEAVAAIWALRLVKDAGEKGATSAKSGQGQKKAHVQ